MRLQNTLVTGQSLSFFHILALLHFSLTWHQSYIHTHTEKDSVETRTEINKGDVCEGIYPDIIEQTQFQQYLISLKNNLF